MKRIELFVFAILGALLNVLYANAYDFSANGIYYDITSEADLTCKVTYEKYENYKYSSSYSGDIVIPTYAKYSGKTYSVTSIGRNAFLNCTNLGRVTISEGVLSIGDRAFAQSSIEYVKIPYSTESVSLNAFASCYNLTNVTFNAKNCNIDGSSSSYSALLFANCISIDFNKAEMIPEKMFFSIDSKLKNVTLGSNVKEIGEHAFCHCREITSIVIPSNVRKINSYAFANCTSLTSLVIQDGLEAIERNAFYGCGKLDNVIFPNSVIKLGHLAFFDCSSLETFTLPNNLEFFGANVLANTQWHRQCQSNTYYYLNDGEILYCFYGSPQNSVEISEGTRIIAGYAFHGSTSNVTEISVPNSVEFLGEGSFSDFPELTKLSLGSGLKTIDGFFLFSCPKLNKLYVHALTPPECLLSDPDGKYAFDFIDKENCTLYVEPEALEAYKNAPHWNEFKKIIPIQSAVLYDKEEYSQTSDSDYETLSYVRNFETTVWQALYIPFDMAYDEWKDLAEVAEISGVHMYDDDEDGAFERSTIEFKRIKNENAVLRPNTPYVIKPKQTGEVTFVCEGKTLKAAEERSVWCATTRQKFTLTGIYQPKEDMTGVYALGTDGKFHRGTSASPALSPNRFYLTIEDVDNGYGSAANGANNAPRVIDLIVDGESTGIETTQASSVDGKCYDLSGRAVKEPKAGIYIKNGKKVIIK